MVEGLGFNLGFRVWRSGFGVEGLGLWVWGVAFGAWGCP